MATQQHRNVYNDDVYAELQRLRATAEQAQAALDDIQKKRAQWREVCRRLPAALAQAALALTSLSFSAAYAAQLGGGWWWGVAWGIGTPVVGTVLRLLAAPDSELFKSK